MTLEKPKFSIIVPVYNVELYLDRCVSSVLSQTFRDYELLLIDDGSTDGSGKLCDAYANKDKRVIAVHKKNGGASSARNEGVEKARAELVLFFDSDDKLSSNTFLDVLYKGICDDECDIYQYPTYALQGEEQHPIKKPEKDGVMNIPLFASQHRMRGEVWGYVFRKSVMNKYDIRYIKGVVLAEDQAFVYSYFAYCKNIKLINCNGEGYIHFNVDNSTGHISNEKRDKHLADHLQATQGIIEHLPHALKQNRSFVCERIAMMIMKYVDLSSFLLPKDEIGKYDRLLKENIKFSWDYTKNNKGLIIVCAFIHLRLGIAAYRLMSKLHG